MKKPQEVQPKTGKETHIHLDGRRRAIHLHAHPGSTVHISLTVEPEPGSPVGPLPGTEAPLPEKPPGLLQRLAARRAFRSADGWLLALSLAIYLAVRLIGLAQYPIYFFTDEAVQSVLASDLLRDGFHGADKQFLPTYFYNSYQYNLGTSVYLQVLPVVLFGHSVWVTRAACVLVSLLAGLAVGLALWQVFSSRMAWAGVLLLSMTPAWFLHSRTAFETGIATSFYAGFLFLYLVYLKSGRPAALYAAAGFGALAFYSYSPMRMVMLLSGLFFLVGNLRRHLQHWKPLLATAGILAVLVIPQLRFQLAHPGENLHHLQVLGSYWNLDIPLGEKLAAYLREYSRGLDPFYWFLADQSDLARHIMDGYGHLLRTTAPLLLAGLALVLRRIRQPAERTLLLALLAAPGGAALVGRGITRMLALVIPAAVLSAMGLEALLEWLSRRARLRRSVLLTGTFALLAGFNFWLLRDALVNGPLWETDYGLGGMQYGAQQLFDAVRQTVAEDPGRKIVLSPSWANGTNNLVLFFFDDPAPFTLGSIEGYLVEKQPLDHQTLFITTPAEYRLANQSGKLTGLVVERTLPCPNGQPCFYFLHASYVKNIDEILAAEKAARAVLQEFQVEVAGETALVRHSYLDMGTIQELFDGDPDSLIRTLEANPLVVDLTFSRPRSLKGVTVKVGGPPTQLTVELYDEADRLLMLQSVEVPDSPNPRDLDLSLRPGAAVRRVRLQVRNTDEGEPAHVHAWEVTFR